MSQSPLARYHAGLEAERSVARAYLRQGYTFMTHRFRGSSGEIDLIMQDGAQIIFIEVKKSKSHAKAANELSARQIDRIMITAAEFLDGDERGLDSDCRFDVALVDEAGHIDVIENALSV